MSRLGGEVAKGSPVMDGRVQAFLARPTKGDRPHVWLPCVWLDATDGAAGREGPIGPVPPPR